MYILNKIHFTSTGNISLFTQLIMFCSFGAESVGKKNKNKKKKTKIVLNYLCSIAKLISIDILIPSGYKFSCYTNGRHYNQHPHTQPYIHIHTFTWVAMQTVDLYGMSADSTRVNEIVK